MDQLITGKTTVAHVLSHWPATVPIFIRHRMACVGCSMSAFETLEEAARVYGLDFAAFMGELENVIQGMTADL